MKAKPTYQELEKKIEVLQQKLEKKESETKFKELFEKSGDAILILENELFKDCNQATVSMLKYDSKEQFLNVHPSKLSPEIQADGRKSIEKADEMMKIALKNGTHRFEWNHIKSNGEIFPAEVLLTLISNKPEKRIIHTVWHDITIRKEAEIALRESEGKFKAIVETASDWIWEIDKMGEYTYSSPKVLSILGYSEKEIMGKTPFDLMPDGEKERVSKVFDEIIKHKAPINKVENTNIHKNGKLVVLETSGMPFFDSNNNLLGYRGIDRDITEYKKSEQSLKESEARLRESNKTKDKFFSILAHDLISPFNSMLGFSKLLEAHFEKYDVQKQKMFLGIINHDLQNTFKLLENLLLWSRAQRGVLEFNPQKENLYLLSIETLSLLRQSAKTKAITLINNITEDVYIKADKNMLLTIMRNLISNAIKFTPKGGTVEIGCRVVAIDRDMLDGTSVRQIYVKDNGIGIPEEKQTQLFDITENTSTKGTEGEKGTGLGLILCKEFVEKHGGKIWFESQVGKGSAFIFTLSK